MWVEEVGRGKAGRRGKELVLPITMATVDDEVRGAAMRVRTLVMTHLSIQMQWKGNRVWISDVGRQPQHEVELLR